MIGLKDRDIVIDGDNPFLNDSLDRLESVETFLSFRDRQRLVSRKTISQWDENMRSQCSGIHVDYLLNRS